MLKFIKSLAKSALMAGTIMYGAMITPEAHNQYLRWEVGESVVQVLHPELNGGGTGFAVQGKSGKEYIMTNRHVCEVQVDGVVRVKVGGREPVLRKVIKMDTVHDLCLIEGVPGLSPLSIGSTSARGDYLYAVGHPGLRQLTTSSGEFIGYRSIELLFEVETPEECPGNLYEADLGYFLVTGKTFVCTKDYDSMETTAVIYPGSSGSPVVNKWGNLVGVIFAGSVRQEHDNFIVPLVYIKSFLNKF